SVAPAPVPRQVYFLSLHDALPILLFHVDTLEILGVHCFGAEAAEIIHIGQAIMCQKGEGNNIGYFLNTTFNYPTMAEAYRIAARSEEHTSELQSREKLVCRLLLGK